MNRRSIIRQAILVLAFLIPWVVCLCDCVFGTAVCDASVFQYMGWRYAAGTGGYARVWDCKGPVLVLFNALGFCLGIAPSVVFAGLWSGIVFMFDRFLIKLGVGRSEVWTLLFVLLFMSMDYVPMINSTETIAVFFALLAVSFVWGSSSEIRWLVVGGASAAVFFTKPNLISFAFALGLVCVIDAVWRHKPWRIVRCIAYSLGGTAIVFGLVHLAFVGNGVREMWDATLGYNLLERCAGIEVSWCGWWCRRLFRQGLGSCFIVTQFWVWFALGGSLVWLGCVRAHRRSADRLLYIMLVIWLIFEMAMVFVSKGYYPHYMLVSLVPMLILLGLAFTGAMLPQCRVCRSAVLGLLVGIYLPATALGVWRIVRQGQLAQPGFDQLARTIPSGSRVAVCGSLVVPEVLTRLNLTTNQKYFSWLLYIKNCFAERRHEIETEFCRSLEVNEWLLSERDIGNRVSSHGFKCLLATERPHVFVYRKIVERALGPVPDRRRVE